MEKKKATEGGYTSKLERDILAKHAKEKDPMANIEKCSTCGNPQLQQSGACKVCPACGTTTGCS